MSVCGGFLDRIQEIRDGLVASGQLGEFLYTMLLPCVLLSNL